MLHLINLEDSSTESFMTIFQVIIEFDVAINLLKIRMIVAYEMGHRRREGVQKLK